MKKIKSPINYTGNKYRLLEQIQPHFPEKVGTFVDLFCGGATVGFNVDAEKVILIDNNKYVIGLLEHLAGQQYEDIKLKLEEIIEKYHLSYSAKYSYKFYKDQIDEPGNNGLKKYNEVGYYTLRNDYNHLQSKFTPDAMNMLYILMVYGFNNDIRFNAKGDFNLPAGKTDLNQTNLNKLKEYFERAQKINYKFVCGDFKEERIQSVIKGADFVYADPPYLITDAVYNEAGGWTEKDETDLIELLTDLKNTGKKFVLSNIASKTDMQNLYLSEWIEKEKDIRMVELKYNYASSTYNKKNRYCEEKEVIVEVKND